MTMVSCFLTHSVVEFAPKTARRAGPSATDGSCNDAGGVAWCSRAI